MNLNYPFTVSVDADGHYLVCFDDLEEAFTEGLTQEEAMSNAAEVLALVLEQRLADGALIPLPTAAPGRPTAAPSAPLQAVLRQRLSRAAEPAAGR